MAGSLKDLYRKVLAIKVSGNSAEGTLQLYNTTPFQFFFLFLPTTFRRCVSVNGGGGGRRCRK